AWAQQAHAPHGSRHDEHAADGTSRRPRGRDQSGGRRRQRPPELAAAVTGGPMTRNHRIIIIAVAIVAVSVSFAGAQIVVTDPATTIKNAAIALLKNDVVDLLTNQATRLRKMAKRLSLATNLDKYSLPDPPAWRIHWFIEDGTFLYANPYTAALNYGDGSGRSFEEVARERVAPGAELAGIGGEGEDGTAALDAIRSE